ncbi:uncharacterized protein [Ptychodera flava]|uniref:uncharacterized protein n=1 Tax=Ptychodera flava TaxID=63121 RepID=UPI00396AA7D4
MADDKTVTFTAINKGRKITFVTPASKLEMVMKNTNLLQTIIDGLPDGPVTEPIDLHVESVSETERSQQSASGTSPSPQQPSHQYSTTQQQQQSTAQQSTELEKSVDVRSVEHEQQTAQHKSTPSKPQPSTAENTNVMSPSEERLDWSEDQIRCLIDLVKKNSTDLDCAKKETSMGKNIK